MYAASPASRRAGGQAGRRILMVWQCYIDESFDEETFVFAGFGAPAENWAALTSEWEKMLPYARRSMKTGEWHFKMSEMASSPESMARARAFFNIIKKHAKFGFFASMPTGGVQSAMNRMRVLNLRNMASDKISITKAANEYYFTMRVLIDMLGNSINRLGLDEEKVDLIFDDNSEKSRIAAAWDAIELNVNAKKHLGNFPRFENDREFLPLQTADFLAWWARQWVGMPLNEWRLPKDWKWPDKFHLMVKMCDNESVFNLFYDLAVQECPPGSIIIDLESLVTSDIVCGDP